LEGFFIHEPSMRKWSALALMVIPLIFLPSIMQAVMAIPQWGASPPTGLIVPLYGQLGEANQTGGEWNQLVRAKQAYPVVPVVAIVNPANGSGQAENLPYASAIDGLRATGIVVLGYVPTSEAQRPIQAVEQDIANYRQWYGVDGIFLDQMPHQPGNESYYANLTRYAKSLGMAMTMGNPGSTTSASYVGTVDALVVYEGVGTPKLPYLASYDNRGYGKGNFAFIADNVTSLNSTYVTEASALVGFMFVSNSPDYFVLPTYFTQEIILLQSLALKQVPLAGPIFAVVDIPAQLLGRGRWSKVLAGPRSWMSAKWNGLRKRGRKGKETAPEDT
jgi:hypothetical protein